MPERIEVEVFLQNNDHVRMLEALLEDARMQESEWRNKCKAAELRLADAQHVNLELIDALKLNGFKFRRTALICVIGSFKRGEWHSP